jgi:hypothetical protein
MNRGNDTNQWRLSCFVVQAKSREMIEMQVTYNACISPTHAPSTANTNKTRCVETNAEPL